jgi:hypothetical protein
MPNDYPDATTAQQAADLNRSLGVDGGNLDSFLSGRASWEEYKRDQTGRTSNTPEPTIDGNNRSSPGNLSNDTREMPDSRDGALDRVSQAYSGGGNNGTTELLSYLKEKDAATQAQQASVRSILMSQLGDASKPVDINDPNLKAQLEPQKLALQRSAERKRSQLAARLSSEGLLDSGAFDTGVLGIEDQRGVGEAAVTGDLLGRETGAKRALLQNLLQMAISSGDAESARNISAQLQALGMEQQESQYSRSLAQGGQQFNDQLGFNYDQLGANVGLQTAGLNQAALLALLGAL